MRKETNIWKDTPGIEQQQRIPLEIIPRDPTPSRSLSSPSGGFQLPYDVHETDCDYILNMEIPGVPLEKLKVEIRGEILSIEGDACQPSREHFLREFRIPPTVDEQDISAAYQDGVLEIRLRKKQGQQKKTIPIEDNRRLSKLPGDR